MKLPIILALVAAMTATAGANPIYVRRAPLPIGPEGFQSSVAARAPAVPFRDLGPAPAAMLVHLVVVLRCRHQADLDALVQAQSDVRSPLMHRVLSAEQFREYFSPTEQVYTAVASSLIRYGFRVERTYANRTVLDVVGTATIVERTFATELHRIGVGRSLGYANVRSAVIPTGLASYVDGIVGFDDLPILHTFNEHAKEMAYPLALGGHLEGPNGAYGPLVFANAYDFPVQHRSGNSGGHYDGSGQAAGVVIDSDVENSDLATFLKEFNIKRTGGLIRVPVDNGGGITYGVTEATLDVETIAGLSPGAAVYIYIVPSLSDVSVLDAYARVNSDDKVGVVNSSFGGCETLTSPSNFPQLSNKLAEQGAALGIVYVAATGDQGAYSCPPDFKGSKPRPQGVSAPASDPFFTAVGGTTLFVHSTGRYALEYGWSGGGAGSSVVFKRPSFQDIGRVKHVVGLMRSIPDVSFDANPGSGAAVYVNGSWAPGPIGGTSLAAPIFAAMVTQLEQMGGQRVTAMNMALYQTFQASGYQEMFNDITYGEDSVYSAAVGFDRLTGIGSINGWQFGKGAVGL